MLDDADYIDYGLQLAFTVLAMASTLLVEPSKPTTFIFAMGIPVLFGHTAYISRNNFSKASSASIIALVFAPIGIITALLAVLLISANLLVSIFSSGESFRGFYGSTSIPLIIIGVLIGSVLTVSMALDPAFEEQVEEEFSEFMTWKTGIMIEQSGIIDSQQEVQQEPMQDLQQSMVSSLQSEVTNHYMNEGGEDAEILEEAFDYADQELQRDLEEEASEELNESEDVERQVESMTSNVIEDRMIYIIIPLLVLGLYAFQPLLGLLTAFSAVFFSLVYHEFS